MMKRSPRKGRKKSPERPELPPLKAALKWLFVLVLWAGIIGGCLVAWYAGELPAITKGVSFARKASITVKGADGSVLARYGEIRGDSVTVQNLPPHLVQAVLATEDRRFYGHFGLDPVGLSRAI